MRGRVPADGVAAQPNDQRTRMILVDTSVWIDHLRESNSTLVSLLETCDVLAHPLVTGELAMGTIRSRGELLSLLGELPTAPVADHHEVLTLIETRGLHGTGLGIVDAHLLACTLLAPGTTLWTRDRRLAEAAARLDIAWSGSS
jgi:predicted nucleic acid-binding protein